VTIVDHQDLIKHIEILVARAGTCDNHIDKELHTKSVELLDTMQQLTAKELI